MSPKSHQTITKHFASLSDPRHGNAQLHSLHDILVIANCAIICGADTWVEVELWGRVNEPWLRTFLRLPNGIPAHDTFGRVFGLLDPQPFRQCFLKWVRAVNKLTRQVIAIDGKKLRCSHNHTLGKNAIQLVSAWATANRVVLGPVQVKDKSNEIRAIPKLLRVWELTGCIVTIDALGCQTKIAEAIVQRKGDYLLAVKENQGQLNPDLQDLFAGCQEANFHKSHMATLERPTKGMDASRFVSVGPCPTLSFWITCPSGAAGKTCELLPCCARSAALD